MTGTIEDTETIHTLTRLLANEIDTSTAMAEGLLELEITHDTLHTEFRELEEVYHEVNEELRTRHEAGVEELNVIKGFVQEGDFLALAEYLQVDVPIPGGKRVQVGDFLETLRDYEDAPVGTVVAFEGINTVEEFEQRAEPDQRSFTKVELDLWDDEENNRSFVGQRRLVVKVPTR